jgi:hypothetical protein
MAQDRPAPPEKSVIKKGHLSSSPCHIGHHNDWSRWFAISNFSHLPVIVSISWGGGLQERKIKLY